MNADMNTRNAMQNSDGGIRWGFNADIFMGAFIAVEYKDAVSNADDFIQTLALFDNDIEALAYSAIDDSSDDLIANHEFIFSEAIANSLSLENELYDDLYDALSSSELHSRLVRAYQCALNHIQFMKGLQT